MSFVKEMKVATDQLRHVPGIPPKLFALMAKGESSHALQSVLAGLSVDERRRLDEYLVANRDDPFAINVYCVYWADQVEFFTDIGTHAESTWDADALPSPEIDWAYKVKCDEAHRAQWKEARRYCLRAIADSNRDVNAVRDRFRSVEV